MAKNRTQYQFSFRVITPGYENEVVWRHSLPGASWRAGRLLTEYIGGRVGPIAGPITSGTAVPVVYIALMDFAGAQSQLVPVYRITPTTVLIGQVASGSATRDHLRARGTLLVGANGNMAFNITNDDPVATILDVEPEFEPWGEYSTGNYNLVKFLIDAAAFAKASTAEPVS